MPTMTTTTFLQRVLAMWSSMRRLPSSKGERLAQTLALTKTTCLQREVITVRSTRRSPSFASVPHALGATTFAQ